MCCMLVSRRGAGAAVVRVTCLLRMRWLSPPWWPGEAAACARKMNNRRKNKSIGRLNWRIMVFDV